MPKEIAIIVLAGLTAITLWIYMAINRRSSSPKSLDALEKRLARLEVAVDDMSAELGRVCEGQTFLTNALTDRPRELIEDRHER